MPPIPGASPGGDLAGPAGGNNGDDRMNDTTREGPERIWIEDERPFGGNCHVWDEPSEAVEQYSVAYVRADIHQAALARAEAAEDEVERLKSDRLYVLGHNDGWSDCVEIWTSAPAAVRHSFDGHGYLYADLGNGSDWFDRAMTYPDAEPIFEAPDKMPASITEAMTIGITDTQKGTRGGAEEIQNTVEQREADAIKMSGLALLARAEAAERALAEARAERDAAVAAAYDAASLVPMDRLAAGESIAPANLGAAIQRLATETERKALAAMLAEAREEGRREADAEIERLREALEQIKALETKYANATVRRMVGVARAALTGEGGE